MGQPQPYAWRNMWRWQFGERNICNNGDFILSIHLLIRA